ncbi:MAG: hypothetical protein NUW00_02400 [Candidatus Kaiserbacteria bacterium]|nr:hypothetical protein [Candidatus Kaiserbacteria bacterium]
MNNITLRSTLITFTSFIFVITAVNAWTGPSVSAPNGNVSAPLTISATSQSKTGGLDVGWLSAVGAVKVGYTATACTADLAGSLRWNTGVMEYCNGTVWGPFVGSGTSGGTNSCLTKAGLMKAYAGKSVTHSGYLGMARATLTVNAEGTYSTCSMQDAYGRTSTLPSQGPDGGAQGGVANAANSVVISAYQGSAFDCTAYYDNGGTLYMTRVVFPEYSDGAFSAGQYRWDMAPANTGQASGVADLPGGSVLNKCTSGGNAVTETDPTVLTSVKDGVSWSEVTGKPDIQLSSGSVVAGCEWASQANPSYCWGGASQQSSEPVTGLCPSGTRIRKMIEAGMGLSFLCIKN